MIVLTTKKQKEKDNEERLTKAMDILNGVAANSTTPRNIRKVFLFVLPMP